MQLYAYEWQWNTRITKLSYTRGTSFPTQSLEKCFLHTNTYWTSLRHNLSRTKVRFSKTLTRMFMKAKKMWSGLVIESTSMSSSKSIRSWCSVTSILTCLLAQTFSDRFLKWAIQIMILATRSELLIDWLRCASSTRSKKTAKSTTSTSAAKVSSNLAASKSSPNA